MNTLFLPLFRKTDELLKKKERVILAIDGGSASGKTTLAALLESAYICNVFSMDDFFLRPQKRSPERLAETGGNIDYERFDAQVLKPLLAGQPFSYRKYDCRANQLSDEIQVTHKRLNVIEGVYSLHPRFFSAYDLRVFLNIKPEYQNERLLKRGVYLYDRFVNEWLPMENKYFDELDIRRKCDIVFPVQ